MKLAVIGASGGTGRELVRAALDEGDEVTAVVRDPARLAFGHANLQIVRGDAMSVDSLRAAIGPRHDAVLSTLGVARGRERVTVLSEGTHNILSAMRSAGVERLVAMSAAGMHPDDADPFVLRYVAKPILQIVFRELYADTARMENVLINSEIAWTIVVPTRLTDGKASTYRLAIDRNVPNAFQVSRANVARCMIEAVRNRETAGHFVYVAD